MHYYLQCKQCGATFKEGKGVYRCPQCGSKLTVKYSKLPETDNMSDWVDTSKPGIWKFWDLLPVSDPEKVISLGEGNTFLHGCDKLAHFGKFAKFWVKDETKNPTGSFKDRNAAIGVTNALGFGAQSVAIASDANAGPAVAAYAAKAGLPCYVFMPVTTSPQRIAQAITFGASVVKIRGNGLVNDCIRIVEELREDFGWHHLTTAGTVNPYQLEGPKTIVYEIAIDMAGHMPDWIVAPAGGGGLIAGMFTGLKELSQANSIDHIPKILCVQSEVCAPIVKAFQEHRSIEQWGKVATTVAVPIAVPLPSEGEEVLEALKVTKGTTIVVSDQELLNAQKILAEREGICASPAGASSAAGALKARRQGIISERESVLAVVTGSGMKDLSTVEVSHLQVPEWAADIEIVRHELMSKLERQKL